MFQLPLSRTTGLPLREHTGLLLVSGLVHDDQDDRQDVIRGALEIDPLLAAWIVITAEGMSTKVTSLASGCRWLADYGAAMLLESPRTVAKAHGQRVRTAWQQVTVRSVATARLARHKACRDEPATGSRAFWLGMHGAVIEQLNALASQNGKSPLGGIQVTWPAWLQSNLHSIRHGIELDPVELAVREAIREVAEQPEIVNDLVSAEERELWFRPYPEFRLMVPLVLEKLQRLETLEERFEVALQREKLASLEQLAYGASHEINNPLANISTRAQTLLSNEPDSDRRRKLVAINRQAFRAYEMIADLMLFAKPPKLDLEEFSVESLIRDLRQELEPVALEKHVRIQLSFEGLSTDVLGDATQLAVAVKAIWLNGIEAMDEGVLSVACRNLTPGSVEIRIDDNGPGLSDQARRHLFDPFYSGREAGRGLGFGLSKAWRIIQQHGGEIEVKSQLALGSSFRITLPRIKSPKPKQPSAPSENS